MNYIVMNNGLRLSEPMSLEEAESKAKQFVELNLYPNAVVVETDEKPKESIALTAPAENVEDVGCAGGACAL